MRPRFLPSARNANWLIAIGFLALGYAFYLRYQVIENSAVGLACDAGKEGASCLARFVATQLFRAQVFGFVALGAALINLMRPSLFLFGIGLAATAAGLVLYNAPLAGLAAGVLIMSFARPAREEA